MAEFISECQLITNLLYHLFLQLTYVVSPDTGSKMSYNGRPDPARRRRVWFGQCYGACFFYATPLMDKL